MKATNILVPTDFSAGSAEALHYAFDLAVALGATLHIVHVVENPFAPGAFMEIYSPPPAQYFIEMEQLAQEKLRALLSAEQQAQVRAVMTSSHGVADDGNSRPVTGTAADRPRRHGHSRPRRRRPVHDGQRCRQGNAKCDLSSPHHP